MSRNIYFQPCNEKIIDHEHAYVFKCHSCHEIKQCNEIKQRESYNKLICNYCLTKILENCPKCSKCNLLNEKNGMCEHMLSTLYDTKFCWMCLEIHDGINMSRHIENENKNIERNEMIHRQCLGRMIPARRNITPKSNIPNHHG